MNIANKLTVLRILLIPAFVAVLLSDISNSKLIAMMIFSFASLTDFLDGYLARKLNLITKLGKFLDPLADKLLVISAMIVFVEIGLLPSWVTIIIISRELIVSVFRAIAASEGIVIAASWWGKLKTNSQMAMVIILLLSGIIPENISGNLNTASIALATIFTLFSGYDYIVKNQQVLADK